MHPNMRGKKIYFFNHVTKARNGELILKYNPFSVDMHFNSTEEVIASEIFQAWYFKTDSKKEKVLEAINQLPARQKEVIYLKIYKGLSYEEVSEIMQINYQVVRNLLCQALKTFRKLVAPCVAALIALCT